jgi:succinoglycan biosynthesis transport protein ExoP
MHMTLCIPIVDGVIKITRENGTMLDQPRGRNITLRDVLFIIFKRLKMIITIFLITVATVVIGVFLSKPVFQSSVKVIINREVSEAVLRVAPWYPLMRSFELEEEINSEIELIKSRAVAEAVVDLFDQQQIQQGSPQQVDAQAVQERDPELDRLSRVLAIQRNIEAEPVKKSDVMLIVFSSHDPQQAMETANAVANAYIDYRAKIYRSSGAVDFFDEQTQVAKNNLDQLEEALKEYRESEALLSYDRQEMILLTKLNEFETSLTGVRKDIVSTDAKLAKIREYMSSPIQPLVPTVEIREEPVISDLHSRLIELRLRLNELLTKYTEDHREVRNLRQEISMAEAELRQEVEKLIDLQESSLSVLRAEEEALRSTVNFLYTDIRALPEKQLTIERLERAIDNHKEVYSMLMLKGEEARISEASDRRIANVSIISPATLPLKPIKPKKAMLIFVGCLIGIIGGFGLAFISEYLDHSLRTSEDVEHYLNLPVLASIPELKKT